MDVQVTIIGAGVAGLAIAEKLSGMINEVFLIERHSGFGQETSSRNSEVIHAGIYYPEGSLKARLCVEGNQLLYDYCKKNSIPFRKCGKLIVATSVNEFEQLDDLQVKAFKNGVDVRMIGKEEIASLEPGIYALRALFSPSTGIIDTYSFMKSLETKALLNGVQIVYKSEVTGIKKIYGGYEVEIMNPDGTSFSYTSRVVINSAGLMSDRVSALVGIKDDNLRIIFCKGEYFRLNPPKNRLLGRLIYPVPLHNLEGIGIHVTVDTGGGVKLGPDVTWLRSNYYDYKVDESKKEAFYISAKKFLPFLEPDDITPDMAGIRPKIQKKGEQVKDFYIKEESERGFPGFINLIGIESPGLTSSLAIANFVSLLIKM